MGTSMSSHHHTSLPSSHRRASSLNRPHLKTATKNNHRSSSASKIELDIQSNVKSVKSNESDRGNSEHNATPVFSHSIQQQYYQVEKEGRVLFKKQVVENQQDIYRLNSIKVQTPNKVVQQTQRQAKRQQDYMVSSIRLQSMSQITFSSAKQQINIQTIDPDQIRVQEVNQIQQQGPLKIKNTNQLINKYLPLPRTKQMSSLIPTSQTIPSKQPTSRSDIYQKLKNHAKKRYKQGTPLKLQTEASPIDSPYGFRTVFSKTQQKILSSRMAQSQSSQLMIPMSRIHSIREKMASAKKRLEMGREKEGRSKDSKGSKGSLQSWSRVKVINF